MGRCPTSGRATVCRSPTTCSAAAPRLRRACRPTCPTTRTACDQGLPTTPVAHECAVRPPEGDARLTRVRRARPARRAARHWAGGSSGRPRAAPAGG
jgi:hypothetical protein